jgi:hypothetical protein
MTASRRRIEAVARVVGHRLDNKMRQDQPMAYPDYGSITIRDARENNLKNVSPDIPKRRITVLTVVSGSGKSSLVFGTIGAESQQLIGRGRDGSSALKTRTAHRSPGAVTRSRLPQNVACGFPESNGLEPI